MQKANLFRHFTQYFPYYCYCSHCSSLLTILIFYLILSIICICIIIIIIQLLIFRNGLLDTALDLICPWLKIIIILFTMIIIYSLPANYLMMALDTTTGQSALSNRIVLIHWLTVLTWGDFSNKEERTMAAGCREEERVMQYSLFLFNFLIN